MDSLFGLVGKDFVVVAADTVQARSILVLRSDIDKIMPLDSHKLLATAGPAGDRYNFSEYIQKNLHLHELRTGIQFDTKAAASFTRNELANALRRGPYQVSCLLGGFDDKKGPSLYWMDYLGSLMSTPATAHGYGAAFVLSVMDKYYTAGMDLEDALDVIRKCIKELKTRFLINTPNFIVKVADKDGIREVAL